MYEVIIVEDEQLTIMEIEELLENQGYEVAGTASDGETAVELVAEKNPDLILMDIRLGSGMDGTETVQKIKEESEVPVVYITAYSDEETLSKARETRPEGYLVKPFTGEQLDETIRMILED